MGLIDRIGDAAAGLHGWGITTAAPFLDVRAEMHARVADGSNAGLRFTYSDIDAATDITQTFPWARRLVVGAHGYAPESGSPGPGAPSTGRVARFATDDHYAPLRQVLGAMATVLRAAGHRAEVLVDDNRLVDRAAAVRAGVGWWGRNTLVLAPGAGPWLLLGSVVTDADLEPTDPMLRDCGTCTACIPACPTGALDEGRLDARRCLSTWLQAPGVFPAQMRTPLGDRIYGCDDCLEACPPGTRTIDGTRRGRHDLVRLLGLDDRSLLDRFTHFYVPRRHARYLRRNVLVALGNAGGVGADLVAAGYLGHPDWLLRLHAAWALGRLGGPGAGAALALHHGRERHDDVRGEIASARLAGTFT